VATPGTVGDSVRQCVLGVLIVGSCVFDAALANCPYFVLPLSVGVTSNKIRLVLRACLAALQGVFEIWEWCVVVVVVVVSIVSLVMSVSASAKSEKNLERLAGLFHK
jgi:hypothetical protein